MLLKSRQCNQFLETLPLGVAIPEFTKRSACFWLDQSNQAACGLLDPSCFVKSIGNFASKKSNEARVGMDTRRRFFPERRILRSGKNLRKTASLFLLYLGGANVRHRCLVREKQCRRSHKKTAEPIFLQRSFKVSFIYSALSNVIFWVCARRLA